MCHVLLITVSTTGKFRSTRGVFSWNLVLRHFENPEMRHEEWSLSLVNTAWAHSLWHLYPLWIQPLVLRLKSCCVCEGGDDDDEDGIGEVLFSWLRVMDGKKEAVLTVLQTHTWLSSLQVCSTLFSLFTFKHDEREDYSVYSGRPSPSVSCSVRKDLSANDIFKRKKSNKWKIPKKKKKVILVPTIWEWQIEE